MNRWTRFTEFVGDVITIGISLLPEALAVTALAWVVLTLVLLL